jgi:hypothetical protein
VVDSPESRSGYNFWQVQHCDAVSHTGMSPWDRRLQILRQSLVELQVPCAVGSAHARIAGGDATAARAPKLIAASTAAA